MPAARRWPATAAGRTLAHGCGPTVALGTRPGVAGRPPSAGDPVTTVGGRACRPGLRPGPSGGGASLPVAPAGSPASRRAARPTQVGRRQPPEGPHHACASRRCRPAARPGHRAGLLVAAASYLAPGTRRGYGAAQPAGCAAGRGPHAEGAEGGGRLYRRPRRACGTAPATSLSTSAPPQGAGWRRLAAATTPRRVRAVLAVGPARGRAGALARVPRAVPAHSVRCLGTPRGGQCGRSPHPPLALRGGRRSATACASGYAARAAAAPQVRLACRCRVRRAQPRAAWLSGHASRGCGPGRRGRRPRLP